MQNPQSLWMVGSSGIVGRARNAVLFDVRFTQWCTCGVQRALRQQQWPAIGLATLVAISTYHGGRGVSGHLANGALGYANAAMFLLHAAEIAIALVARGTAPGKTKQASDAT